MPSHLVIGYSDWGKKITNFLIKKKYFSKIYIVNSKKFFEIFPKYKLLNKKKFKNKTKEINTIHICSSVKTHLKYFELFKNKNLIIEKPIVDSLKQLSRFKKIFRKKRKKSLVNYTDLFNDNLTKLKKKSFFNNSKQLNLTYSKKSKVYYNKIDFFNDWLDHPLSIILYLFGKLNNNGIHVYIKKNKLKKFEGFLKLKYIYKNIKINVIISNIEKKEHRLISILNNKKTKTINLKKNNSFEKIYNQLLKENKKLSHQNLIFHAKIFKEKRKIINKIKNL